MNIIALDNYINKKSRVPFILSLLCVIVMIALFFQPFTTIRVDKYDNMYLEYYGDELRDAGEYYELDRSLFDLVKELITTNSSQVKTGSKNGVKYVVFENEAVINYALPCAIGIFVIIALLGVLFRSVKMCVISDLLMFGAVAAIYSMLGNVYGVVMHQFEISSTSIEMPYTIWGIAIYAYAIVNVVFFICAVWLGIAKTRAKKEFEKNNPM